MGTKDDVFMGIANLDYDLRINKWSKDGGYLMIYFFCELLGFVYPLALPCDFNLWRGPNCLIIGFIAILVNVNGSFGMR